MEERKGFGTNFGFLMASVGSAVGLGNIWGFPNKMGANGGFTFLIIYLILAVLCGFIVMVGELALGRKTGQGVVTAYKVLSKKFRWVGWLGILSPFFILFFYCALGGYCLKYTVLNIGNLFNAGFGSNGMSGAEVFGAFMDNPTEAVIYGLIFVLLTMIIVMGGIGTVPGPILGAIVMTFISEYARAIFASYSGLNMLTYGILVIFIVLYLPGGIISVFNKEVRQLAKARRRARFGKKGGDV